MLTRRVTSSEFTRPNLEALIAGLAESDSLALAPIHASTTCMHSGTLASHPNAKLKQPWDIVQVRVPSLTAMVRGTVGLRLVVFFPSAGQLDPTGFKNTLRAVIY